MLFPTARIPAVGMLKPSGLWSRHSEACSDDLKPSSAPVDTTYGVISISSSKSLASRRSVSRSEVTCVLLANVLGQETSTTYLASSFSIKPRSVPE